ncbi:hypothetical protein SAMCCGM7_Ch2000 [Sinorhizobium americanum CCGM7]|nr:hypothetical protein SAMCCGM7_Ch2000 [Sinorhizobium americanum CCGM7]
MPWFQTATSLSGIRQKRNRATMVVESFHSASIPKSCDLGIRTCSNSKCYSDLSASDRTRGAVEAATS